MMNQRTFSKNILRGLLFSELVSLFKQIIVIILYMNELIEDAISL